MTPDSMVVAMKVEQPSALKHDSMTNMAVASASPADPAAESVPVGDMAAPAASQQSEPLVLIQTETDQGTGAHRATEVSATNVTIGG
jgi:hypothetical protein